MKIKDLTQSKVCEYMKLDYSELDVEEVALLNGAMDAALAYIVGYTGLEKDRVEEMDDMSIAYLCIIQDMYDNRALQIDKNTLNKTISTILDMHSVNLL